MSDQRNNAINRGQSVSELGARFERKMSLSSRPASFAPGPPRSTRGGGNGSSRGMAGRGRGRMVRGGRVRRFRRVRRGRGGGRRPQRSAPSFPQEQQEQEQTAPTETTSQFRGVSVFPSRENDREENTNEPSEEQPEAEMENEIPKEPKIIQRLPQHQVRIILPQQHQQQTKISQPPQQELPKPKPKPNRSPPLPQLPQTKSNKPLPTLPSLPSEELEDEELEDEDELLEVLEEDIGDLESLENQNEEEELEPEGLSLPLPKKPLPKIIQPFPMGGMRLPGMGGVRDESKNERVNKTRKQHFPQPPPQEQQQQEEEEEDYNEEEEEGEGEEEKQPRHQLPMKRNLPPSPVIKQQKMLIQPMRQQPMLIQPNRQQQPLPQPKREPPKREPPKREPPKREQQQPLPQPNRQQQPMLIQPNRQQQQQPMLIQPMRQQPMLFQPNRQQPPLPQPNRQQQQFDESEGHYEEGEEESEEEESEEEEFDYENVENEGGEEDISSLPMDEESIKCSRLAPTRSDLLEDFKKIGFVVPAFKNPKLIEKYLSKSTNNRERDDYAKLKSVNVPITSLSPYKTDNQYACPRFEIQRKGGGSIQFLWECNMIEKVFVQLSPVDYTTIDKFDFWKLTKVEMVKIKPGEDVLNLSFRGRKKDVALRCSTRSKLWKLDELCKLAIPTCSAWIPDLFSNLFDDSTSTKKKKVKRMQLSGVVNLQVNKGGRMAVQQRNLKSVNFVVGQQYEKMNCFCTTWSLFQRDLSFGPSKRKFTFKKLFPPGSDIYAICVQGMGKAKADYVDYFSEFFTTEMGCQLVSGSAAGSVGLFIFVHKKKVRRVSNCSKPKKKNGLCIEVTLTYNESPITFIGVQLPLCGNEQKTKLFQQVFSEEDPMITHHTILIGDFQYELSLPTSMAISYAKRDKSLLNFDGFYRHRKQSGILLDGFKEGEIFFPPTHPIKEGEGLGWTYDMNSPLSFCGRVLIKSLPYLESNILGYYGNFNLCNVGTVAPVCSLISLDTQRCHISHFSKPPASRVIKFDGLYVGGYTGDNLLKEPQLLFSGDWVENRPCFTKREKGMIVANPRFRKSEIPQVKPVKCSVEFLASVYLKIQLVDGGKVRGTAILPVVSLFDENQLLGNEDLGSTNEDEEDESEGHWFSVPFVLGCVTVGELLGSGKILSFVKMRKKV